MRCTSDGGVEETQARYAASAAIKAKIYGADDRRSVEMRRGERCAAHLAYAAKTDEKYVNLQRQPTVHDHRIGRFDGVEMELGVELRIPPHFPNSELFKGQQGFALIRYDINEKGKFENPTVVIDRPGGVITERSLKSVSKWT